MNRLRVLVNSAPKLSTNYSFHCKNIYLYKWFALLASAAGIFMFEWENSRKKGATTHNFQHSLPEVLVDVFQPKPVLKKTPNSSETA